jgi:4-hydroxybenzoate polyprenyltransferase/phosphoserine phosphatase
MLLANNTRLPESYADLPLVLDLDGTLIRADLTHELLVLSALSQPFKLPAQASMGLRNKAAMKADMITHQGHRIDVDNLPYNERVVEMAEAHYLAGGQVYLCSGSHGDIVAKIVEKFPWLKEGWGTSDELNLTSSRKASFLQKRFPAGFIYVGNSKQDFAVWEVATQGIAINPPRKTANLMSLSGDSIAIAERPQGRVKMLLNCMRIHQWAKNGLILLVPILTFGELSLLDFIYVILGFLAMSFLASSTYILNDLIDIGDDRTHPTKRNRMLASGRVSIPVGLGLMVGLLTLSILMSAFLPFGFWLILALYALVTLTYSLYIKRIAIADVLTLSGLFSIRVFAGAALVSQSVSPWLINFIATFFLTLALVKRYTELRKYIGTDTTHSLNPLTETIHGARSGLRGRGYSKEDEPIILAFGVAIASLALLSFFLYGTLAETPVITHGVSILAISTILLYWTMRVWFLAHRGQLNDDPVLFAIKDRMSRIMGVIIALIVILEQVKVAGLL